MKTRKYSVRYSEAVYNFLIENAKDYTIKELSKILNEKFNVEVDKKRLAQYCIKMGIKYKYEYFKKSHDNKPTKIGTLVTKTDGKMIKIKTGKHKWEYLQRKIYEDYYNVKLPEDVYVIFLNQNKKDFNIKNLKALPRRNSAIMSARGLFSSNKKVTKVGITISNLDIKRLEAKNVKIK